MGKIRTLLLAAMILLSAPAARAQLIAVNTDVAMDAIAAPSLGVELVLGKKSSLNLNALYGEKVFYRNMRIAALQPEWRIYLSGRPMYHHYFGVIGLLASYKMKFDGKWHDGDASGLGLSFGYVLPMTDRLLVDFHTSLGGVYYHQKEYNDGDSYDRKHLNSDGYPVANASGGHIIPLRIGVALTYIIK